MISKLELNNKMFFSQRWILMIDAYQMSVLCTLYVCGTGGTKNCCQNSIAINPKGYIAYF